MCLIYQINILVESVYSASLYCKFTHNKKNICKLSIKNLRTILKISRFYCIFLYRTKIQNIWKEGFFMNKAIWEFLMEMKKNKLTFETYELCPSLETLSVEERIVLDEYAKDFRVKIDGGNQWV